MQKIYHLEERCGMYFFHFFIYNLGGVYHIMKDQTIQYPIMIHMNNLHPFQREAFEIIKNKCQLIEHIPEGSEVVNIYGETQVKDTYCDDKNVYPFIRNLFLDNMKYNIIPNKKIFITRKNSEGQHYGVLKRYMYNENEIMEKLKKHGFEYIQLEDYNMHDKIKLFMESEVIMSTNSGSLTLSLFCNTDSKIIEICNKGTIGFTHGHYIDICSKLNLKYFKYSNIEEDFNGNFNLNYETFEPFLLDVINK